jgi:hypothetical protein
MGVIKRCSTGFLAFLFILNSCNTYSTDAATLLIPKVKQKYSNWCWAASAQMVGRWSVPTNSSRTQTDAVIYTYGAPVNYTATATQTKNAATYVAKNYATFIPLTNMSLASIKNVVNSFNNPLIAGCINYNNAGYGHMVVIHGVDTSNNLLICDPATGTSRYITYSTLQSYSYVETVLTYDQYTED